MGREVVVVDAVVGITLVTGEDFESKVTVTAVVRAVTVVTFGVVALPLDDVALFKVNSVVAVDGEDALVLTWGGPTMSPLMFTQVYPPGLGESRQTSGKQTWWMHGF